MATKPLLPLVLDRAPSPATSELGTECTDLPPASDPALVARAAAAKQALDDQVVILGHHYQKQEVIQFADARGDSYKLAKFAAEAGAPYVVFLGVHFMAESADILTGDDQQVILPDLAAGCSMADMAEIGQVEEAWAAIEAVSAGSTVPLTYMNSSAAIKALTGREGGAICTSSNAAAAMRWAFERKDKILFLPDQHLGRNTAVRALGLSMDDCLVWDPYRDMGGLTDEQIESAKVLLWKGHCSVHQRFQPEHVAAVRERVPGVRVIVHPECRYEVVEAADDVGSTEHIISTIAAAEPGSKWAVGTELNLVTRIASEHPDKTVVFLDRTVCFCATMNRIDLPHLVWALENLTQGRVVNRVHVEPETAQWARVALQRMLEIS
ncbi:MAG TPA: quinolinate synthase NadA [Actinomycetota bacterium]|nr:quinolinate synthase NadA [Actinomycetota bacterium]